MIRSSTPSLARAIPLPYILGKGMVRARLYTYDDFNVHNLNCYSPLNPLTRKFSNYVLIPRVPLLDEIKLLKNLKKDLLTTLLVMEEH